MTNQQIFDAIEQGEVLCDLLYATGASALQARLEANDVLAHAMVRMQSDADFQVACVKRARAASRQPAIEGFLHPDRTVVAAYMYLLFNSDNEDGLGLIRELAIQNRRDWAEVTDLIREYAWRRPGLEIQSPVEKFKCTIMVTQSSNEGDNCNSEAANRSGNDNFLVRKAYARAV